MKAVFSRIQNVLLEELDKATATIEIAVAWITNVVILKCLIDKITKGVKVTIVLNNDEINNNITNKPYLSRLIKEGGSLHWINYPELMHQKFCIIDSRIVANGSYNWTYYAEMHNRENIVVLDDETIVDAFKNEFARLTKKYPVLNTIPEVGKSSIKDSFLKTIKKEEHGLFNNYKNDAVEYRIISEWNMNSSINIELDSSNDFRAIIRRKPKSIEKVLQPELEENQFQSHFDEVLTPGDTLGKERHLFKVFVDSASSPINCHISDHQMINVELSAYFEPQAKYAVLLYSSYSITDTYNHHNLYRYDIYRIPVKIQVDTDNIEDIGFSIENMVGVKEDIKYSESGDILYNSVPDGKCYYLIIRPKVDTHCSIVVKTPYQTKQWVLDVKAETIYYLGYICNLSKRYNSKKIFIDNGIKI